MEPGSIGPWPSQKVSCDTFEFLATRVRVYLVSETVNLPFGEFKGLIGNFSLGRLSLVSLKLQQASAYYLVLYFIAFPCSNVALWSQCGVTLT